MNRERQHTRQDYKQSNVLGAETEESPYNDIWPPRLPSSARKYQQLSGQRVRYEFQPEIVHTAIPPRRSAQTTRAKATEEPQAVRPRRRRRGFFAHPVLYLGIGMLFMLALWQGLTVFNNWWQVHQDDATYGRPRTFQLDGVVGHADSPTNPTHFIIVNLNRHIMIIELPGGDPSHARIYSGPTLFGDGQELTPVTAKIEDVNGDGKPDLVLFIQDQRIVFLNENGQFRPLRPEEHVTVQ